MGAHRSPPESEIIAQAQATARGFEPLRAEPNGFRVHHLNHSVTLSWPACLPFVNKRTSIRASSFSYFQKNETSTLGTLIVAQVCLALMQRFAPEPQLLPSPLPSPLHIAADFVGKTTPGASTSVFRVVTKYTKPGCQSAFLQCIFGRSCLPPCRWHVFPVNVATGAGGRKLWD